MTASVLPSGLSVEGDRAVRMEIRVVADGGRVFGQVGIEYREGRAGGEGRRDELAARQTRLPRVVELAVVHVGPRFADAGKADAGEQCGRKQQHPERNALTSGSHLVLH